MTPNQWAHYALSTDCAHEGGRRIAACMFCLRRAFEQAMKEARDSREPSNHPAKPDGCDAA